jgi:hypothetical protein
MSTYAHRYNTETDYTVVEYFETKGSRIIEKDQHDYLDWVKAGNTPTVEATGQFLTVVGDKIVVDPMKDTILAQVEAIKKQAEAAAAIDALCITASPLLIKVQITVDEKEKADVLAALADIQVQIDGQTTIIETTKAARAEIVKAVQEVTCA